MKATPLQASAAAAVVADEAYREAIALQIQGRDASAAWERFRVVVARSIMLTMLTGYTAAVGLAQRLGAPKPEPEKQDNARADLVRILSDEGDAFKAEPFVAAIEAATSKIPVGSLEMQSLLKASEALSQTIRLSEEATALTSLVKRSTAVREAVRGSFWVTDATEATTVTLRDLVADTIRGASDGTGYTLPEFIDKAQVSGAANLSRARLEVVLRNNTARAYSDGHVAAAKDPAVRRVVPLQQIDEIRDRRTRGNPGGLYPDGGPHFQMDGYINTIDEIERQGLQPPNGHQCRARLRPVSIPRARRLGLVDDQGQPLPDAIKTYNGARQGIIDRGEYPDEGFNG